MPWGRMPQHTRAGRSHVSGIVLWNNGSNVKALYLKGRTDGREIQRPQISRKGLEASEKRHVGIGSEKLYVGGGVHSTAAGVRNQATVGVYIRGVSTVCSAVYIRRRKKRDKCEECGRTMSRSTNHHGLLLDKYNSIYNE